MRRLESVRRLRSRLAAEGGFTLVELMVAMAILAVGVMATIGVMDRSRQLGDRSEARETIAVQAERELERITALAFNRIGHRTVPGAGTAGTPQAKVSGGQYQFDQDTTPRNEPLRTVAATIPAGQAAAETVSATWTDNQNRMTGRVWRFITEPAGEPRMRRITVVSTGDVKSGGEPAPPVLVSTIVTDPRP